MSSKRFLHRTTSCLVRYQQVEINNELIENTNKTPVYILKGKNTFRYLLILMLIGLLIAGIYTIQYVGFIMIIFILIAIFGLLIIQFPYLYIYEDFFMINYKSVLKIFSDKKMFDYNKLINVEYKKGHINWRQLIIQSILGKGAYGGFSQPDQMIIKYKDNKKEVINRIGKRNEFEGAIKMINEKIKASS